MRYARLTRQQAEALRDRLAPMLRFLAGCRRRLDEIGADPKGKLYQSVCKAHDAVHGLRVTAHYESVGSGVGDLPDEKEQSKSAKS